MPAEGVQDRDWQTVIDGCWPAARVVRAGPWTIRVTHGAGGRVSAISGDAPDDLDRAIAATRAEGQRPGFVVWPHQGALDAALAARGYVVEDAVNLYAVAVAGAEPPPIATAFPVWPPLQAMRDIWEAGGIGPARQAVMARAADPTGLLARCGDRAGGTAFVAAHGDAAMLSAVEVLPPCRRRGLAGLLLRAGLVWAASRGCAVLGLVTTRDNAAANAAYAAHGMARLGGYHYRRAPRA
ncbi:GNAT family N-acetyltransferase [Jannaschia sp. LMIT008]|uniref:GNAT family N-acetyltransferase n=1 Tax=Jannaschia maritima TaxID=3032585 RepID=UPI002811A33B|nr:GNAT family N-acetyltransferase [Jannaschia sp. LMIT008]